MYEAIKVALDPTPAQERCLLSHAGAARFAFNAALAHVKKAIEAGEKAEWSFYSLRKWWNHNKGELAVDDDGVIWWSDNSKEAYSYGVESLAKGLSNWANSRKGTRKGHRVGFPKFKSKNKSTPRFAYATGSFGLIDGDPKALKLPRIGRVHCMENAAARMGDARVTRMTISQHAGRWYASLTVEREDKPAVRAPRRAARSAWTWVLRRSPLSRTARSLRTRATSKSRNRNSSVHRGHSVVRCRGPTGAVRQKPGSLVPTLIYPTNARTHYTSSLHTSQASTRKSASRT